MLGGAIVNVGEYIRNGVIPFFRSSGVLVFDPIILVDKIKLSNKPSHFVAFFQIFISPLYDGSRHDNDFGFFQCFQGIKADIFSHEG